MAATDASAAAVQAWGSDHYGQLGHGSDISRLTSTMINGLTNKIDVAACCISGHALASDGSL